MIGLAMRPIPVFRRGPRRAAASRPKRHIFGCPRVSPEWELGAFLALTKPKPQHAGTILNARAQQPWPKRAAQQFEAVRAIVGERLGYHPNVHLGAAGDYHFIAEVSDAEVPLARAAALMLSKRTPGMWFVVGRIFVRDGRFFRRERGYKLNLVEATNVHLPREVHGALRGVI